MGWKAHYSKHVGNVSLYIESIGCEQVVTALTLATVPSGERWPPNDLFHGRAREAEEFMQAVLDAAYDAGLRPSKIDKPEPQLMPIPPEFAALKAHLEDMRKVAAKVMGVNL